MVSIEEMNGQQNVDIAVLKNEVKEIKENHLFHLSNDLKELRKDVFAGFERQSKMISDLSLKIAYYTGGLAVLIAVARFLSSFVDK